MKFIIILRKSTALHLKSYFSLVYKIQAFMHSSSSIVRIGKISWAGSSWLHHVGPAGYQNTESVHYTSLRVTLAMIHTDKGGIYHVLFFITYFTGNFTRL